MGFLLLLAMGVLASAFSILPVRAAGTIYINADGSISPSTAPISTVGNVTYVLTGNISSATDGIVIERTSYIVIDGNGYTLQGSGTGNGISAQGGSFTVKNFKIRNFFEGVESQFGNVTISRNNITCGLSLDACTANVVENNIIGYVYVGACASISQNNITGSVYAVAEGPCGSFSVSGNHVTGGISVSGDSSSTLSWNEVMGGILIGGDSGTFISGNNIAGGINLLSGYDDATISGNNITGGIQTSESSFLNISANNITTNRSGTGIYLKEPVDSANISENNICENEVGISIDSVEGIPPRTYLHEPITIYHNNFINDTLPVHFHVNSSNSWDDGYPSGGNYWGNYNGTDSRRGLFQNVSGSDGIGDTPYIIDSNNTDHFPLEKPYAGPHDIGITSLVPSKRIVGQGCPVTIDTTVLNYGNSIEVLNVTIYINGKSIATFNNLTVPRRMSTTLEFSLLNTTGIPYGNYTLRAALSPVPGERDTSDNTITNGTITITIQGDTNGDKKVNVLDLIPIATHLGILPNSLHWNANLDLNNDGAINVLDLIICATHMGQRW